MGVTDVRAPVDGTVVALSEVADPVFAQAMVGHGAAIDPPRAAVDVLAPVSGRVVRLLAHAFVVLTADRVGVLVHLGLDTVSCRGGEFTPHLAQGDEVTCGQRVITYDVAAVAALGLDPVVAVVIMDERQPETVAAVAAGRRIAAGSTLFSHRAS